MSRRSNQRRQEQPRDALPSSEAGSATSQSTALFYPSESASSRQKMLLLIPILLELIWIAYLIYLVIIK
jgi:hypothetical protein